MKALSMSLLKKCKYTDFNSKRLSKLKYLRVSVETQSKKMSNGNTGMSASLENRIRNYENYCNSKLGNLMRKLVEETRDALRDIQSMSNNITQDLQDLEEQASEHMEKIFDEIDSVQQMLEDTMSKFDEKADDFY